MLLTACLVFWFVAASSALDCARCGYVRSPQSCQHFETCNSGDRCYTTSHGVGIETTFDLGCKTKSECLGNASASLVDRSLGHQPCSLCCAEDHCNQQLCEIGSQVIDEVEACGNDPNYNCQKISKVLNICTDIHRAKLVCRKWCGLCNLVDGMWSKWSSWTACDVTCETGTLTRSRTCTEPAPAHGGLSCTGNNTDIKPCTLSTCPIHGGWSSWQTWSSCSSTCGIGTQSRHRSCDNPIPQHTGNPCFGDNVDFRTCFIKSCADGGWSSWSMWSTCSRGLNTRTRACNNPQPSLFGRDCVGDYKENILCDTSRHTVAFTVNIPNRTLIDGRPIFTDIIINVGGGYDPNTATFTCPISGLYLFTFNIQTDGKYQIYCYIFKNEASLTYALTSGVHSLGTATTSTYIQLTVGDIVQLNSCGHWDHVYTAPSVSFSGALVGG